jgi:hypothetical protein
MIGRGSPKAGLMRGSPKAGAARGSPKTSNLVSARVNSGLTGISNRISPPRPGGMLGQKSIQAENVQSGVFSEKKGSITGSVNKLEQLKRSHYPNSIAARRSPRASARASPKPSEGTDYSSMLPTP